MMSPITHQIGSAMFLETDPKKREELKNELRACELLWNINANPLHVWEAIAIAYSLHMQLPPWITTYLGVAALKIRTKYAAFSLGKETGREAQLIGEMLAFGNLAGKQGRGSCFEELKRLENDMLIHERYQEVLEVEKKPTLAEGVVGKLFGVSASAVRRACQRAERVVRPLSKLCSPTSNTP
jgi:hypothetical protein